MSKLLVLDTLDDRREIHHLLGKLPPRHRVAFLNWCAGQVNEKGNTPHPFFDHSLLDLARRSAEADLRVTNEVYSDVWILIGQWGLDPTKAAVELESRVRKLNKIAQ